VDLSIWFLSQEKKKKKKKKEKEGRKKI